MKRIMIATVGLLFSGTPAFAGINPMNVDFGGFGALFGTVACP